MYINLKNINASDSKKGNHDDDQRDMMSLLIQEIENYHVSLSFSCIYIAFFDQEIIPRVLTPEILFKEYKNDIIDYVIYPFRLFTFIVSPLIVS